MKKKSFNKKLVLHKRTIANLNENEMTSVKGGGGRTHDCNGVSVFAWCIAHPEKTYFCE